MTIIFYLSNKKRGAFISQLAIIFIELEMTKYLEMISCSKIQFSILVNIGLVSTCLPLSIFQSNSSTEINQKSLTHGQYCYLNSDCKVIELCIDLNCERSSI
jgi:hypothetical protein